MDWIIRKTKKGLKKYLRKLKNHLKDIQNSLEILEKEGEFYIPSEKIGRDFSEMMLKIGELLSLTGDHQTHMKFVRMEKLARDPEISLEKLRGYWTGWWELGDPEMQETILKCVLANPSIQLLCLEDPELGAKIEEAKRSMSFVVENQVKVS